MIRKTTIKSTIPAPGLTGVAVCAVLLAGCTSGTVDGTEIRTTPQAVHPATAAKPASTPTVYAADKLSNAQAAKLANEIFDRFCLNKSSQKATEAALRRSGEFKAPKPLKAGQAQYIFYPLADGTRGGVTVIYNSIGDLQCSVGIQNIGPNLYKGGRITRP